MHFFSSVVFSRFLRVLVTETGLVVFTLLYALSYDSPCLHSVDPYGFERSNDFDYESYEELMSEYLAVLTKRSIKWSKLLKGKNHFERNLKGECLRS